MKYETTRATDIEASRRVLERERIRERRDARIEVLVVVGLTALWVATVIAMALKTTGVLP